MKRGYGSVGLALIATLVVGWTVRQQTPTHAYRLTVEVATPNGSKQASVIRYVFAPCSGTLNKWFGVGPPVKLQGQAVFVELGDKQNLVALMAAGTMGEYVDQPNYLAYNAMQEAGLINKNLPPSVPRLPQCEFTLQEGTTALSPRLFPTFVNFPDLNDPASGRVIEPTRAGFAAAFGPGYQLERVTLEMVPTGIWPLNLAGLWGSSATTGIENKIPFLTTHRSQLRSVMRDMPPRYQAEFWQFIRD